MTRAATAGPARGTVTDFRTFIEEVRSRSDIVAVIGADMELRPVGATLKALSPFHPESSPSFVVWPSSQSWHDFSNGGGLGGDVFNYIQERDPIGFKETVFMLAERFKITKAVGAHKARTGLPPADPAREAAQIARLRRLAEDAKLDPDFAEKFLNFIVKEVIRHHEAIAKSRT